MIFIYVNSPQFHSFLYAFSIKPFFPWLWFLFKRKLTESVNQDKCSFAQGPNKLDCILGHFHLICIKIAWDALIFQKVYTEKSFIIISFYLIRMIDVGLSWDWEESVVTLKQKCLIRCNINTKDTSRHNGRNMGLIEI